MRFEPEISTWELIDPLSVKPTENRHEELQGGVGKQIHFRQERYEVAELLKDVQYLNPRVTSEAFEGSMVDFAITGALCAVTGPPKVERGAVLEDVRILIGVESFYQGRAKVAHVKAVGTPEEQVTQIGLQLLDDVIDVPRVFRARSMAEMAAEMSHAEGLRRHELIQPVYKQAVSEYLYLLVRYRSLMNHQQEQLGGVAPSARHALEVEILESAWAQLRTPIMELQDQLDALTTDHYFDREFQRIHQSFTMPLVTPHLATAPVLFHSWYKPLGYAGDHVLMTYIYDQAWEGKSLFGKLMHRYGVEHQASGAVRARKDLLKGILRDTVREYQEAGNEGPCKILSLGSGPAREAVEFTQEYDGDQEVLFTLIDQDNTALGFVNGNLSSAMVQSGGKVSARYLYVSFLQLLSDRELFQSVPQADLLYCAGLFDYLSTGKAAALIVDLMHKVKPGGSLVIGNFGGLPQHAWVTTYTLDWNLRYRTRQEMQDLLDVLQGAISEGEVVTEATGLQYFIKVRKKG